MTCKRLISSALALLATSVSIGAATAATITWQSNDGSLGDTAAWSNANNWIGGASPTDGDDVVITIPVALGSRITNNDLPAGTQINGISITANLNEVNGNSINLGGNVAYTAGGSSIGRMGAPAVLLQDTTYSVSANTSNGRLEVGGGISGGFGIEKADAGRLRFVGTAKTYSGDTIVSGGILDFGNDNMMPFGAGKGDVYLGAGSQFTLINTNMQINGLNDYSGGAGTLSKSGSNTRSLTVGNGDASGNFTGPATFTGGSSTIHKVGAGSQAFGGTVAVIGASNVTGGKMLVNGAWTASSGSAFNVSAGATLGGSGTITGSTAINGTVAPGASTGTLDVSGAVNLNNNSLVDVEIGGGTPGDGLGNYDQLNMTSASGAVNLTGVVNLALALTDGFTPSASDVFYILTRADGGAFGSFFDGQPEGSEVDLGSNYRGKITYQANWSGSQGGSSTSGGNDVAIYAIVPEPTGLFAALLALAASWAVARRRGK
jgi:fibronectin-binding autotransporter adhesin